MNIIELIERPDISENLKLSRLYAQFGALLKQAGRKELPDKVIKSVNQQIDALNSSSFTGNALKRLIRQKQTKTIHLLEKELKIVPKNYYCNLWLAVGMSAFGLPIGVAIGLNRGNMGLMAIGLPIGMIIGMMVGASMDKKAAKEGRQLDIEIKF